MERQRGTRDAHAGRGQEAQGGGPNDWGHQLLTLKLSMGDKEDRNGREDVGTVVGK